MIHRTVQVSVTPSPREIEECIWTMNSVEQTDLVLAMTQRLNDRWFFTLDRIDKLKNNFVASLNDEERKHAAVLFKAIASALEYEKGD